MTEPKSFADVLLDVIDGMLHDMAPGVIADTSVEECRHLLWFFGDRDLGQEPGGFVTKLLEAAAQADLVHLALLGRSFPFLAAFDIVRNDPRGMDLLRDRVRGHETAKAEAFGMPAPVADEAPKPAPPASPLTPRAHQVARQTGCSPESAQRGLDAGWLR